MQEKRDLKMEKIRSPNDALKGYLKMCDQWNSQIFQGISTGHHKNWNFQKHICGSWSVH